MHLIRDDEPIPFDHSVVRSHSVPGFDPETARLECRTEMIDIGSWYDSDPFVKTIPGRTEAKVFDASGKLIFAGAPDLACRGAIGGGRFFELSPNDPTHVESRKEYRARLRREAKRQAEMDAESWW